MSDRPLGPQVRANTVVGYREVKPFSNNPMDQRKHKMTIRGDGQRIHVEPREHEDVARLMLERGARLGHRVEGRIDDKFRGFLVDSVTNVSVS